MRQMALQTVYKMAQKDSSIIFIGSDLGAGTLDNMRRELPNQFFMEGISEQYLIGFAAGLAQEGFKPFVNTIGTFLTRRAFEQISIDIGLHNLPVRILASGGGMVYAPLGPTHTSIEDFALMLTIPNMKVFAPADAIEMEKLLESSLTDPAPYYIRFGKGGEREVTKEFVTFNGEPKIFGELKSKILLFTTGIILQHCLEAKQVIEASGLTCAVVHFPYLNDLKLFRLHPIINQNTLILCLEEHIYRGGLYTQVLHEFAALRKSISNIFQISLPLEFPHKYGSQLDHLDEIGLTGPKIANSVVKLFSKIDSG
jgi:transketolase